MNKIALLSGAVAMLTPVMLETATAGSSWSEWKTFDDEGMWKYKSRWISNDDFEIQIRVFKGTKWGYNKTYFISNIKAKCRNGGEDIGDSWSASDPTKYPTGHTFRHVVYNLCSGLGGPQSVNWETGWRYTVAPRDPHCFITTAACNTLGLNDDCILLQALRHFRDTYMNETSALRADVEKYYDVAPRIVKRIADLGLDDRLYPALARGHLLPAFAQIKGRDLNGAYATYKRMVDQLEDELLG